MFFFNGTQGDVGVIKFLRLASPYCLFVAAAMFESRCIVLALTLYCVFDAEIGYFAAHFEHEAVFSFTLGYYQPRKEITSF